MQGHFEYHENQVSSRDSSSTTAAMDDPQPALPSTSTAPQIRSRITVVCAECKRLKLKCDRRTPCGSCTKRDTVSRCIYSPAAAEKVDLHSINNRLIQVETLLSMITSGKTPPPFQSSYPLAQVPIGSSQSGTARPSHVASNTASPISIRMHDLVNIWLVHCQLDIFTPGNHASLRSPPQDGPFIKLEQSPVELLQLFGSDPYHKDTILIDQSSANRNDAPTARRTLPPPQLYSTQGQKESSYFPQDPFPSDSQGKLSSASPSGQLFVAPAIFAYLPHPSVRIRLLDGAHSAIPYLSLLINWTRVAELADTGVAAARAEEDRQASSANAVFDAQTASHSPSPLPLASSSSAPSLPLFACLCYLLALGAVESPDDTSVDHSFLYALAGQAIGVWEEYRSFSDAKEEENYLDSVDDSVDAIKAKQAEEEKDDLDHVVALLLQVKYLLHTGSATSVKALSEAIFPLIGKLVNAARGVGLARDPELETGVRRNTKAEERRRMIWWDIMFYDIFTSDVLDQTPLITSYSYNTRLPTIAHAPSCPPNPCKQSDVNVGGNDEGDPSTGHGVEDERRPLFTKASCPTKSRIPSRLITSPKTKTKAKACSPILDNAETGFFGVRCRLTRLTQSIKTRLAHPDCDCCTCESSYTLDQAAKLEAEIRAWVLDLPSSLRLDPPSTPETKCPKHTAIAAELALFANRIIISAYVPLMRPPQDGAASSSSSVYSAAHPWNPASRATLDAAQGVVRAASVLYRLPRNGMSFMCDLYPLQKAVADALVICAHSGFASTKPGRIVVLVDEVNIALEVLDVIGAPEGKMSRLLASMKRRIESGDVCRKGEESTLKRKRTALQASQPIERVKVNGHMETTPMAVDSDRKANDSMSSVSQQSHRPVIPPSSQRQKSVPRSNKGNDRKHSKKSLYPVLGYRDREKESAHWWLMKKVNVAKIEGPISEELPVEEMHPNNFQSQQLSPIQHPITSGQPIVDNEYRSRSSSVSHTSRLQTSECPPHYTEEQDEDIHASQRRRFSINDASQHQHHQLQQVQQPFMSSPYIQNQQSSRIGSYEAPSSFDQSGGSFDQGSTSSDSVYGGPPSPYANSSSGHLSAASSPYGSATGHPQTPVIYPSRNSHHPSPPDFVQQSAVPSPQTYYHMSSGYEPYEVHAVQQQQVSKMDSPIPEQNRIPTPPGEAMISRVSQALPIYEKTVYDVKTPVELVQQQHQIHHYQVSSGRGTPVDHLPTNSSTPQSWTASQYIHSQQPFAEHQDSQYWSTGQMYYS
ncbi:hypothetical protein C0993_001842 [Termitomyces sp. T159_Od127]|nr:hypothetical protein C0993_001842 [Termitomyces sp. T159_Od127]